MKRVLIIALALAAAVVCRAQGSAFWADPDSGFQQPDKVFVNSVWRGSKANAAAAFKPSSDAVVTVRAGELRCGKSVIDASAVSACFLKYVIGDELLDQYNQCGARDTVNYTAMRAADIISGETQLPAKAGELCPVWLSIKVPADAVPGKYKGSLSFITGDKVAATLSYTVKVIDRVLPPLGESPFHLDLWQNPYAVARYHNVPLWSKEHFDLLRPVMKMLADAGQKVITTTILDRPWNGQTEDPFGSMVTKIRLADGSWMYDYTIFDMWVEFMMSLGIDSQINCYSMIPWALNFDYFDQASYKVASLHAEPGSAEYEMYWGNFIRDFASHLREKGWFSKTHIAMDERPEASMKAALALIKKVEPEFKVALAGNYHESIADEIDDLCIALAQTYPEGKVAERKAAGQSSIYYTCCAEKYPNTFIASKPSEASWLPWIAMARGDEGYLRWAFNSWTIDPLKDARFRSWAAGDCYMVYPGAVSSVRFEKLIEGLQDYFKAVILLDEWSAGGKDAAKATVLKDAVSAFTVENLGAEGPAKALKEARKALEQ